MVDNCADPELLDLIRKNNEKAFAVIVHRYRRQLYSQIFRRLGCEESAKDVLQEIYISLWKNRHTIHIEDSFLPYLSKSAHYIVIDQYLHAQKKKAAHAWIAAESRQEAWPVEADIVAADLASVFAGRLRKMPDKVQQVFMLSRKEGLSIREISVKLGLSEQTVKNYISLVLQALQETLRKEQAFFYIGAGILLS